MGTPLWRTIWQRNVSEQRISARTLHSIIQRRARQVLIATGTPLAEAGTRAATFSTHSLRRGALTSLGAAGATLPEIMNLSRHANGSTSIAMGYVQPTEAGPKAIRKKLGL